MSVPSAAFVKVAKTKMTAVKEKEVAAINNNGEKKEGLVKEKKKRNRKGKGEFSVEVTRLETRF